MPNPKSFWSILPDYLIGLALGATAGGLTQVYKTTQEPIFLGFAVFFGLLSVWVMGTILKGLL